MERSPSSVVEVGYGGSASERVAPEREYNKRLVLDHYKSELQTKVGLGDSLSTQECLKKVPQAITRVETEGGKSCVTELTGGRGVIGDAVRERRIQHRAKDTKLLRDQSKRHRQGRECEHEIEKIRSLVIMENPPPRH